MDESAAYGAQASLTVRPTQRFPLEVIPQAPCDILRLREIGGTHTHTRIQRSMRMNLHANHLIHPRQCLVAMHEIIANVQEERETIHDQLVLRRQTKIEPVSFVAQPHSFVHLTVRLIHHIVSMRPDTLIIHEIQTQTATVTIGAPQHGSIAEGENRMTILDILRAQISSPSIIIYLAERSGKGEVMLQTQRNSWRKKRSVLSNTVLRIIHTIHQGDRKRIIVQPPIRHGGGAIGEVDDGKPRLQVNAPRNSELKIREEGDMRIVLPPNRHIVRVFEPIVMVPIGGISEVDLIIEFEPIRYVENPRAIRAEERDRLSQTVVMETRK